MEEFVNKIHLVEYNGRILGSYYNWEDANIFILGCLQNGLMKTNATIKTYRGNSCYCIKTDIITLENKIDEQIIQEIDKIETNEQKQEVDYNNPAVLEMAKQKIELQHKINLLKTQKKKIEESKNTFTNDLKLFDLFTNSLKKDPKFIIPEIFIKKFEIMTKLKQDNKLTWEDFIKEYQHENFYNDYFGLNSYEEMFINSDSEDISEEIEINSTSDGSSVDSDDIETDSEDDTSSS